jgi:DNA-binding LacI/PurR family transcriptional regulator
MPESRSLRIAVLIDHIESDYAIDALRGVVRAAHRSRTKVLILTGGWLGASADEPVTRNFVYDLLLAARVDGLLVMAGSLSNVCGLDHFRSWLQRYGRLPVVTAGLEVIGYPSFFVDNETGFYQVVNHLIGEHQRRRIAFIGGSRDSTEVTARQHAYERALLEQGLQSDSRLIVHAQAHAQSGGLTREDGRAALIELLDTRKFSPATLDAVVGTNDDVALGALDELARRGINVPGAVVVVGFDDAPTARTANPPLTTVNQRVDEQTYSAARALIEQLHGGTPATSQGLDATPVYRASCGCGARFFNDTLAMGAAPLTLARSCRLALIERRVPITAELARAAAGRVVGVPGWESRVLDALSRYFATSEVASFMVEIQQLARRHMSAGGDISTYHDILTTLRQQAIACAQVEPSMRPRMEDLFQEARLVLAHLGADFDKDHERLLSRHLRLVVQACLNLAGRGATTELADVLDEHLPEMGIRSYSISRFRDQVGPNETLEVLARHSLAIGLNPTKFLLGKDLGLDPMLEQEEAMIISPLEFAHQPLGIAAFAWGANNPLHYEQLREVLSASIR